MTGHRARWSARSCGRAALSSESSDDHQLFTGAPWQSLARCQQRDWWAHAWHGDSSAHRFQVRAAGAIRNVLDGRALTQLQCNGQQLQCTVHTVGSCFLSRCMHSALLLRGKDAPCYVVPVLRRAGTELPCSRLTVRHRGTAGSSVSAQVVVHHASSNCWRRFRASDDAWCNFFGKVMQCEARFCVGLPQVPHHSTRHQRTESLIPITHSTRASVVLA